MSTTARRRDYCFTVNNYTVEDENEITALTVNTKVRYFIVGKEIGTEGTPHLQGYVYFHNAIALLGLKKLLTRAHFEPCKGTPDQNIDYCSKEGSYVEYGSRPVSQKRRGELGSEYWDNVLDKAKTGRMDELDSSVTVRHYRTLRLIEKDYMPKVPDMPDTCGVWYHGPTGTGKSFAARRDFPDPYLKMCNKWWDGYQKEEFVLIEDFDKVHAHLGHHLKIWADRYAFLAESKGSAHQIRPTKIIVTSNWHPREIWSDVPQTLDPIMRRFLITNFVSLGHSP